MSLELKVRVMDFDERVRLFDRFRDAEKRLILLDYDGTLVPYFDNPGLAVPDKKTIDLLCQLTSNPQNTVVVISGRDRHTLETWFSQVPVGLVAEHGAYYRPSGTGEWTSGDFDSESWMPAAKKVFSSLTEEFEGTFTEVKTHSLTWHYRKAKLGDELAVVQRACRLLTICNADGQFNVICGKKVIEAKSVLFDKGKFAAEYVASQQFDIVLAIGDDTADEDMFRRLTAPNCYTMRVGLAGTSAMYNLIGIGNVHSFLDQLTYIRPAMNNLSA